MKPPLSFSPDDQLAMQRLAPYMTPELRNNPQGLEAILPFYKVGGDKLARIAIDAYNQTQRLEEARAQRMRLQAALVDDSIEDADIDEDESEGDEIDKTEKDSGQELAFDSEDEENDEADDD